MAYEINHIFGSGCIHHLQKVSLMLRYEAVSGEIIDQSPSLPKALGDLLDESVSCVQFSAFDLEYCRCG